MSQKSKKLLEYKISTKFHKLIGTRLNLQKVDSLVEDELEVILAPSPNPYCSMLPAR